MMNSWPVLRGQPETLRDILPRPQLVTERLQLLTEVVPQHTRVAVLGHPNAYSDQTMDGMVKEAEHAALR
jgi:hypothetical protein